MTEWIALLRGVNVGGITVTNTRLTAVLDRLGMRSPRTVLASGNAIFFADGTAGELQETLRRALSAEFDYPAHVLVRERSVIEHILARYPFEPSPTHHSNLVFLEPAADHLFAEVADLAGDHERVAQGAGVLYWQVPKGESTTTPVARVLSRKSYRPVTTTRTVGTVRKLLDA